MKGTAPTPFSGWVALTIASLLSSCNEVQPTDCKIIEKEVFACLDRFATSAGQLAFFGECMPMAPAQRFHGTWATDFEFNQFTNGEVLPAREAWKFSEPTTRLWGKDLQPYEAHKSASVLEIEFIGRKPICNLTEPVRDILVDKVTRIRVIDQRPSEWQ